MNTSHVRFPFGCWLYTEYSMILVLIVPGDLPVQHSGAGMGGISDGVKQTPSLLLSGWHCHLHTPRCPLVGDTMRWTRCRTGAGYVTKVCVVTSSWALGGHRRRGRHRHPARNRDTEGTQCYRCWVRGVGTAGGIRNQNWKGPHRSLPGMTPDQEHGALIIALFILQMAVAA